MPKSKNKMVDTGMCYAFFDVFFQKNAISILAQDFDYNRNYTTLLCYSFHWQGKRLRNRVLLLRSEVL